MFVFGNIILRRPDSSLGKKLTATVTAAAGTAAGSVRGPARVSGGGGKPGKPGTARLMSGRSILVERHDNEVTDRGTSSSLSTHPAVSN